ncbi:MAG TPA: PRTRC system ThiF family protein [Pyrinomonadaceae bacterium]|jgi:PRTRC genetic system ThiF family protein
MSRKSRRKKGKQHELRQQPYRPQTEVLPPLDTSFLDAATIIVHPWTTLELLIVGAGGIGTYIAQHVGRIMHHLYMDGKLVHLKIVDPQQVGEENVGRQLYCPAEIGLNKAEVLARRYGFAWGLNTSFYVGEFDEKLRQTGVDLTIIIGCVDGAAGRRAMNAALDQNESGEAPRVWWLDCGNAHDTGQVILGSTLDPMDMRGAFPMKEVCIKLPSPALLYPELLEERPEERADNNLSCAEMAAANQQSLNINAMIAAQASDMLTRLLITQDLRRFCCQVNASAGVVNSTYATVEEVARACRKPAVFLQRTDPAHEAAA